MALSRWHTEDRNVTSLTVRQSNNTTITIPVINGAFSTYLHINYPVELTLSAVDSTGTLRTMSLCLDGDQLPEKAEKLYGFDPLNPDSDSKLTAKNESGNGVVDGMEIAHNGVFLFNCFLGWFVLWGLRVGGLSDCERTLI